jgi:hypothetical protein
MRLFLVVIMIAFLLIAFRVYRSRSASHLNVTPDAEGKSRK